MPMYKDRDAVWHPFLNLVHGQKMFDDSHLQKT